MSRTTAAWRGVIVYLALAYGFSWTAQVALVAVLRRLAGTPAVSFVATLVAVPALMWPPAIGAFVARRWVERSASPTRDCAGHARGTSRSPGSDRRC